MGGACLGCPPRVYDYGFIKIENVDRVNYRNVNKDLTTKDQDKDKDLTPKDQDKDKDLKSKDQDKDQDKDHILTYQTFNGERA